MLLMICWAVGERGQQEEPLVLAQGISIRAQPWGSWGCCSGAFSADLAVGCAAEDAAAAPACLPLSTPCPCSPPALCSATPGVLCCSHADQLLSLQQGIAWAACSALCSDILSPQILPAPLVGTADPPLHNISRAQENVFLSRCRVSVH